MGWAVLKITDGTKANTIDLLSPKSGYLLDDWRPAIQIPKSGGIWNGSPLTDGRRLAMRNYENAIEVFNLKASKGSQDELIRELQNLFRLMDMAVNYWITGWQTCPVWIEARATNESNSRYATIMDYRISGLNNPYAQPFFACPSIEDELALTVEHDYWMEQPPGTATAIQISAQQAFNGVTYGRSATALDEVFIGNKHVMANITHVFAYDAPAGTFSANKIGAALPTEILPAPANLTTGDRIYIGVDTSVANSGPFSSVIFDITTPSVGISGISWFYRSSAGGGTWVALSVVDTTGNFATSGTTSVWFVPPDLWTTVAVNGVTGYWIYGEVTVGIPPLTTPQQGNRDIYSAVVPFVDIDDLQVPGDVPALLKGICESGGNIEAANVASMNLFAGLRTKARGTSFTPYINISDEQNQTGITITAGTDVAIATWIASPTGRAYLWQSTTNAEAERIRISFSNTLLAHYYGRYAVFLRANVFDPGLDTAYVYLQASYRTSDDDKFVLYESKQQIASEFMQILDFGIMTIPDEDVYSFDISIYGADPSVDAEIYFFDLILMPVDEFAAKYSATWDSDVSGITMNQGDYIVFDSITSPKKYHRSALFRDGDQIVSLMNTNAAGQSILQPNAEQRLWFFLEGGTVYVGSSYVRQEHIFKIQLSRMARYMAMRGNR